MDWITPEECRTRLTQRFFRRVRKRKRQRHRAAESLEARLLLAAEIGAWDFDDGTAADQSGIADGTLRSGATILNDVERGAVLTINRPNASVEIPHQPDLLLGADNADFSVTFRIRLIEDAAGAWRRLLHKGDANTDRTFAIMLRPNSNRLHFRISTTEHYNEGGNSNQTLLVNQWTHVAYVKAGNELQLYLDGKLDSRVTLSGLSIANTGSLWVGDAPFGTPAPAMFDDLRIFSGALSAADVADVAVGAVPGPVARYDFDSGSADDSIGNAHGTFVGGAGVVDDAGETVAALNSVSDEIRIDHQPALNLGDNDADFTVAMRVKLQSEPTGQWRTLFRKGDHWSERTPSLFVHPDTNHLHFRASTDEAWNEGGDSSGQLRSGEWTDIAMVKRGRELMLYVHGIVDRSVLLTGGTVGNLGPLHLGEAGASAAVLFDNVLLYDRALSDDELRLLSDSRSSIPGSVGGSNSGHDAKSVAYDRRMSDPVVFLGPPTMNEKAGGVAEVVAISDRDFAWRFQEFSDGDGQHARETLGWLALEPGRYIFPDGGMWEIGRTMFSATTTSPTGFVEQSFSSSFPGRPAVILTPQESFDGQPAQARINGVNQNGFAAAIELPQAIQQDAAFRSVAWLAAWHPDGAGVAMIGQDEYAWSTQRIVADEGGTLVNSQFLHALGDQTVDDEQRHLTESIDVLQIDDYVFAQLVSHVETDPVFLRMNRNPARQFNGHVYVRTPEKMSWSDAQVFAENLGGNLVTISSGEEEAFLKSSFGPSTAYWTGLNDVRQEGVFEWVSGEPVSYTNWLAGEPNDSSGTQDYVRMNKSASRQWADASGSSLMYGLVEIGGASLTESGLVAEYFSDPDLQNRVLSGLDATIDFDWQFSAPVGGVPADNFSVRWSGLVQAEFSETYTFFTQSDDGVRLWIDDRLLIDAWQDQSAEHSGRIDLQAGRFYNIRLEYYDRAGLASVRLDWSSALQPRETIPADRLASGNGQSETADGSGFVLEPIVDGGLVQPMTFAAAPDGRIFVAEKDGRVQVVRDGIVVETFIDLSAQTNSGHDRGLVGLALDPDFASNGYVYINHTVETDPANPDSAESEAPAGGRLIRVTASAGNPDVANLSSLVTVLDGHVMSHNTHTVGDIEFDNDGNLVFSWGDGGFDPDLRLSTQDPNSKQGKIFRVNRYTFTGVPGNPWYDADNPDSTASKVLAVGVRNSWRMHVDRPTGDIYISEVTDFGPEEVNVLRNAAGANLGWPYFEGGNPTGYATPPAGFTQQLPFIELPHRNISGGDAIVGGAVYRAAVYPSIYDGRFFFGNFSNGTLYSADATGAYQQFGSTGDFSGIVDIQQGPDGTLWMANLYSNQILRLVPNGSAGINLVPEVVVTASVSTGPSPLSVHFDARQSSDPNGDAITFSWDFDNDGIVDSTAPAPTHIFPAPGIYATTLLVSDAGGATQTKLLETRVLAADPLDGNVALGQPVQQSSTKNEQAASRAVDGLSDAGDRYSETIRERTPWWQVDLQQSVNIDTVEVHSVPGQELNDFWVLVSETPFDSGNLGAVRSAPSVVAVPVESTVAGVLSLRVNATGRYVRIQRASTMASLALAEVRILRPAPGVAGNSGGGAAGSSGISNRVAVLDLDGDGTVQPLTDGVLVTRFLAGFSGRSLINGIVDDSLAEVVADRLNDLKTAGLLDVNGDGQADPLSDGILLTRSMAGFAEDSLFAGIVDSDGAKARVRSRIEEFGEASFSMELYADEDEELDALFAGEA